MGNDDDRARRLRPTGPRDENLHLPFHTSLRAKGRWASCGPVRLPRSAYQWMTSPDSPPPSDIASRLHDSQPPATLTRGHVREPVERGQLAGGDWLPPPARGAISGWGPGRQI